MAAEQNSGSTLEEIRDFFKRPDEDVFYVGLRMIKDDLVDPGEHCMRVALLRNTRKEEPNFGMAIRAIDYLKGQDIWNDIRKGIVQSSFEIIVKETGKALSLTEKLAGYAYRTAGRLANRVERGNLTIEELESGNVGCDLPPWADKACGLAAEMAAGVWLFKNDQSQAKRLIEYFQSKGKETGDIWDIVLLMATLGDKQLVLDQDRTREVEGGGMAVAFGIIRPNVD